MQAGAADGESQRMPGVVMRQCGQGGLPSGAAKQLQV